MVVLLLLLLLLLALVNDQLDVALPPADGAIVGSDGDDDEGETLGERRLLPTDDGDEGEPSRIEFDEDDDDVVVVVVELALALVLALTSSVEEGV